MTLLPYRDQEAVAAESYKDPEIPVESDMTLVSNLKTLSSALQSGDVNRTWSAWKKVDKDLIQLGDAFFGSGGDEENPQTMQGINQNEVKSCCDEVRTKCEEKLAVRSGGDESVGAGGEKLKKLAKFILENLPAILALFTM